jgi:hypothetical protein
MHIAYLQFFRASPTTSLEKHLDAGLLMFLLPGGQPFYRSVLSYKPTRIVEFWYFILANKVLPNLTVDYMKTRVSFFSRAIVRM